MVIGRHSLAVRSAPTVSEPDLAPEFKRVVAAAIRWAWTEVGTRWPDVILDGHEEEITERLHWVLNELDHENRRAAPGLELFDAVARGSKVPTSDGRIEKAPDLVFRPPDRRGVRNLTDWGLFVECKIVNAAVRHHSPVLYCEKGVARFVTGEYARRMPSASLLAFVRDGSFPAASLDPFLADYATVEHSPGDSMDEFLSVHERSAHGCVPIALFHQWLRRLAPGVP